MTSGVATRVAAPSARRLRRPSWRDPRLLIGLVLVFTSVAVGARVVAVAERSAPVYVARMTLPAGTPLTAEVLQVARMRLSGTDAGYLDAARPLPVGRVLIRTVGAGEVVPLAATATAEQIRTRPVSIPFAGTPPTGLQPGGLVDLWASARRRDGAGYEQPERIARSVEVSHVDDLGAGLSAGRTGAVQVLLPAEFLSPVLDALANDATIAILPIPGGTD